MKTKYLISGIAALVLLSLGGFLIKTYGSAKYKEGKAFAERECIATNAEQNQDVIRERNRVENETRNLSDSDINRELVDLGIMRPDEDR